MSTLDFRDLPEDRLSTTDEEGRRMWIIPARVRGYWKTRKTFFHIILLAIFVLTPWLRWHGSPLVLFDIYHRQFVLFGYVFAAHDGPLMFFVLGILGFGLIIATAIWGRIWCGWACPQTVFIEQVFRRIETLVVGNRASQVAAMKDPLQWVHFRKLTLKWILFVAVSAFLAHTFIAYFVSWERLLSMMQKPPSESWTVFLVVSFFTALILFDFAWFREQFCIIMCPYGRFQSVLMDQNSVTVAYDYLRGEPRGKGLQKKEGQGDCIDCYKCVSVCPTGIDIRRGTQLECVACTACIDACDEVMEKINRPKGLIRYAALSDLEKGGRKFWRPRLIGYMGVMVLMVVGLIYSLSNHQSLYMAVLRQNQRPYVVSENGLINNFKMHLKNPTFDPVEYEISLDSEKAQLSPPVIQGALAANEDAHRPFFITIKDWESSLPSTLPIRVRYKVKNEWSEKMYEVAPVTPKK